MKKIQADFGGGSITEPQLEAEFHAGAAGPERRPARRGSTSSSRSGSTPRTRAAAGRTSRRSPGPGLNGPGFFCAPTITYTLTPAAPTGSNGWYTGNVALAWQVDNGLDPTTTTTGCVDQTLRDRRDVHRVVLGHEHDRLGGPGGRDGQARRDGARDDGVARADADRRLVLASNGHADSEATPRSGVASTSYRLDGGAWTTYTGPFFVASFGPHTLEFRSTDDAGNVEATKTISWGSDFSAAAQLAGPVGLRDEPRAREGARRTACSDHLDEAAKRLGKPKDACNELDEFVQDVINEAGKDKPRLTYRAGRPAALGEPDRDAARVHPRRLDAARRRARGARADADDRRLGLDKPVANDLGNRARQLGQQIAAQDDKNACTAGGGPVEEDRRPEGARASSPPPRPRCSTPTIGADRARARLLKHDAGRPRRGRPASA